MKWYRFLPGLARVSLIILAGLLMAGSVIASPQDTPKPAGDPEKDLFLVDQVKPVPANLSNACNSIQANDILAYLRFLSSDLMEGRETATRGYDLAANYAASMFAAWGLKPAGDFQAPSVPRGGRMAMAMPMGAGGEGTRERGYLQTVPLLETAEPESQVEYSWSAGPALRSRTFTQNVDYGYSSIGRSETLTAPVVFAGYGIREEPAGYNDFQGLDVKGKIILVLTGVPRQNDPESPFNKGDLKEKYNPGRRFRMTANPKTAAAREAGALAILTVDLSQGPEAMLRFQGRPVNDAEPIIPQERRNLSLAEKTAAMPWESIPSLNISKDMADALLAAGGKKIEDLKALIDKELKPASLELTGSSLKISTTVQTKLTKSCNVLAWLEGSDPELKEEVVLYGAHLDHLGMRGEYIYNGADDNGSGSAGVLEIAQAFATGDKPKRSVIFALWCGEEKGLLGSRYYTLHPFLPVEKTVACINLDMISRPWTGENLERASRMMGVSLSEATMKKIEMNKFLSLSLSETPALYNAFKANNEFVGLSLYLRQSKNASGGSDHAPFGQKGVPWVFFFASMHDDYHQPNDTVDLINAGYAEKLTRLAFLAGWSMAAQ